MATSGDSAPRPNILMITCDQYRFPRFSYGEDAGFDEQLKQILGFQGEIDDSNRFWQFFPGLLRLRRNAVVLRNHTIAAAGLDVFEGEPSVNPALLTVPNVVLTPHIASATIPTRRAMADLAADNLISFLSGKGPLTPIVSPKK